jgi:ribonuclease HII
MDLWEIENSLFDDGYNIVAGVDEAGRGPLAGPVCAAAVILPKNLQIEGLNDSKKLSPKKRDKLYDIIIENAVSYGIGFASVEEIDRYNILNATYMAMNRALEKLNVIPDIAIIDGNRSEGVTFKNICVVGGDGKSASVAAASILAKVTRDRLMEELDRQYPQYQFSKHKGYGTKLHYEKIREFGASPIHRKTFLKKMH